MEEWLMGGKWLFNLPNMGQMLNEFIKEGSLRKFQQSKEAQKAEALVEDTAMTITETKNTREVGAEALIAMSAIGIGGGSGTIGIGVGAAA